MVEKVNYCKKCKNVYKPDEIICPKCNIPLEESDFLKHEDIGPFLKELGFSDNIVNFYSKNKS